MEKQSHTPPHRSPKFRVFANGVSLVLTELAFWVGLIILWYSIKRIAPNVQLERMTWWPVLLILPLTLGVFIWGLRMKQVWAKTLADESLWPKILPHWRPHLHGWRFFFWRTAMAAALIGVLDLKIGAKLKEVKSEGVDVMIAIDVSTSMEAEDTGVSRLALAKQSVQRIINELDGDRAGLVIFAGDAFVQCPITTDYGAIKLFLDGITTDLVPVQGTAVGRAIEVCANGFDPESVAAKMIIVLTDGENHEDDAVSMAEDAANQGIEVHTIGMGSPTGAPIPLYDRMGRPRGFKSDSEGNPIVTALDEATLIEVANAGNGTYVQAGVGFVNINPVVGAMNGMEQTEMSTVSYTEFSHQFHYFFLSAIFLLLCESALHWIPRANSNTHS
ncbi:MAG: VWA domain-containing protein [Flavobacteriales bacterium]